MTEDEAKGKWCPFARVTAFGKVSVSDEDSEHAVAVIGHGSNRIVCIDEEIHAQIGVALEKHGWTRCIGSKCMAWREQYAIDSDGHEVPGGRCGLVPA